MLRRLLLGTLLLTGASPVLKAAELDAVLPKQTESVIYVNVRQMLDSELIKKYALGQIKQMMAGNDDVQKMIKDLGLDPLKDIDRVTIGAWGKDKDDMMAVGVIRGRFDPVKLFEAAEKESKNNGDKIGIVREGEVKLVKFTLDDQPKPFYATLLDETTVIAGNEKKLVIESLKSLKEKQKPELNKDLAMLLLNQDEKATFYTVGLVDAGELNLPPNMNNIPGVDGEKLAEQLQKMKTFAMNLKLTNDVSLDLSMGMESQDAADDFGETLEQLVGTVKGFLPLVIQNRAEFQPLAEEVGKTLKSTAKGKEVTLTLKLSGNAISRAAGQGD